MDLELLVVPYDSAHQGWRSGAGPEALLRAGLEARLTAQGHRVWVTPIHPPADSYRAEIRTAFELQRALAERVRDAVADGRLPVVLAGNCGTAVGTVAGLHERQLGVVPKAIERLSQHHSDIYVHVDLDVLDPGEARANIFAAPDGMSLDAVEAAIRVVGNASRVAAVALTAYDPSFDEDGRAQRAALRLLDTLVGAAAGNTT